MIRRSKPVQLLEWGQGTSQANQNWTVFGKGKIARDEKKSHGLRIITVELEGSGGKTNSRDDTVKIAQEGEGMTPTPGKWGEVGYGRLKGASSEGGKNLIEIEIKVAVKIGR